MRRTLALLVTPLAALLLPACSTPNDVIVLGMIHAEHRESARYPLAVVARTIEAIDPDAVIAEIPPYAMADAERQFRESGAITSGRVSVFPEYTDVVFPLRDRLGFEIVPAAAWTPEMAAHRREKLDLWKTQRPESTARVEAGFASVDERIAGLGHATDDPLFIHTDAYDAIVRAGVKPYNDLFNVDLGHGGWDNINAAHYLLIRDELDRRSGRGQTLVITYGAWHKHWFLDRLRDRERTRGDLRVLDPTPYLAEALGRPR